MFLYVNRCVYYLQPVFWTYLKSEYTKPDEKLNPLKYNYLMYKATHKFINSPDSAVEDSLKGLVLVNPSIGIL